MIPIEFAFPSFSSKADDDCEVVYCVPSRIGSHNVEYLKVKAEDLVKAHNDHCAGPPKATLKEVCNNHIIRFRAVSRWAHAQKGIGVPLFTEKQGSRTLIVGFVPWKAKHHDSMLLSVPELMKRAGVPPIRVLGSEFYPTEFAEYRIAQFLLSKWADKEPKWKFAIPHFERDSPQEWITALDKLAVARVKVHLSQLGGAHLHGSDWVDQPKEKRAKWTEHARAVLHGNDPEQAIAMTTRWARSRLLKVEKNRLKIIFSKGASIVDVDGSEEVLVQNQTEKESVSIQVGSLALPDVPPGASIGVSNVKGKIIQEVWPDGGEVMEGALQINCSNSANDALWQDEDASGYSPVAKQKVKNEKLTIRCVDKAAGSGFGLTENPGVVVISIPKGEG